jgi:hypothetical protein
MRIATVRPARPDLTIPIPGTASTLVEPRPVDVESPWWSALIAEGSVVEITDADASAAPEPTAPEPTDED